MQLEQLAAAVVELHGLVAVALGIDSSRGSVQNAVPGDRISILARQQRGRDRLR
jgi:hypothetical protein